MLDRNAVHRRVLTVATFPRHLPTRCLGGLDGSFLCLWPFLATEASTRPLSLPPGEHTHLSTSTNALIRCNAQLCLHRNASPDLCAALQVVFRWLQRRSAARRSLYDPHQALHTNTRPAFQRQHLTFHISDHLRFYC